MEKKMLDGRILYLANEANNWEDCSPVGCGNLAAMLYGHVGHERIQLNEEFIWAGGPLENPKRIRECIDHMLEMVKKGEVSEADQWARDNMDDCFNRIKSYETAGDLCLDIHGDAPEFEDYRREIDLTDGFAYVTYKLGGVNYRRELIASYPDNVIAFRMTADKPGSITFKSYFEREKDNFVKRADRNIITLTGETQSGGHIFEIKLGFYADGGSVSVSPEGAAVSGADSCTVYITIETKESSRRTAPDIEKLAARGYDDIKKISVADHAALMNRSDITVLGDDDAKQYPTSERLERLRDGKSDNGMATLYFNFGKYLLIGSSRPGTLPANLQGKWCTNVFAPWNSDYHTNINLQMNYWPAETATLSECAEPLFDYMDKFLLEAGKKTAQECYHCRGTVLHHVSDVYGMTAPADGIWGLWPLGGAWLCYNMWEHYLFTLDEDYLRNIAYPYIKESARFFLDYMIEDENGVLLSGPSTSPENSYKLNGKEAMLCMSPTMDIEIIGGLLDFYVKAEELLGIDKEMADEARTAIGKMPPLKLGSDGRLLEWMEEYEEVDVGHRHISHAFGLYPGWSITYDKTPELFAGVKKSIEKRLEGGGAHTGWSAAWVLNLYAHILDGKGAGEMLKKLFTKSTNTNLLDEHPPFQIDGNFGGTAAIAEMVLQSRDGIVRLLPAIPENWKSGSFRGLCVRGGYEADAQWTDGKLVSFTIRSTVGSGKLHVFAGGKEYDLELAKGESVKIDA